jgi:putative inorganic carbon (HCO3(-)) transporter
MSSQHRTSSDAALGGQKIADDHSSIQESTGSPIDNGGQAQSRSSFWHDRAVELGMILAMIFYYVVGNANLAHTGFFAHLNPLIALPFLLIFVVLCWYRLSFAVALLPLALPYYLLPKTVYSHYNFSLAEITLWICLGIAFVQLILWQGTWRYWLSWREFRDRIGLFGIPIAVFIVAAALSVVFAYDAHVALRAFRVEIFDPMLYVLLMLYCFRSRQDIVRLVCAFLASALIIGLLGIAQYIFFRYTLVPDVYGLVRITAVYGSANDIGIFFDYTVPFALSLIVADTRQIVGSRGSWWLRALAVVYCLFMLFVMIMLDSLGTWVAMAVAVLFLAAMSIRNRRVLWTGAAVLIVAAFAVAVVYHTKIYEFVFTHHANANDVSTTQKRLYLWQSALQMIRDYPWFGVGMDNWLCHYSLNTLCYTPHLHHYWITVNPLTGQQTGINQEPNLQNPQNDLLNIWVSIGIFGLLAYVATIVLFYWQFVRIVKRILSGLVERSGLLLWLLIGIGTAFLASLVQGQVDSAILAEDFAFCFWSLVGVLMLLRYFTKTPWRGPVRAIEDRQGLSWERLRTKKASP